MVFASKENPCYFCDICGHFGALLVFTFFYVLDLVTFVIFAILAIFVMNGLASKKNPCYFLRYLRTFRGPSCLHLLLSFESYYICYSCDFCDICDEWFLLARKILVTFAIFADISGPSCLHLLLSLESCYICYSCDSCDICNE